jgi:uncharacterized protein
VNTFRLYPFPYETEKGHYLYDPCTNDFFEVDGELYKAACKAVRSRNPGQAWNKIKLLPSSARELEEYRSNGCLCASEVEIIPFPTIEMCCSILPEKWRTPKTVTIEVTEDCNLKCTYCEYSNDGGHRRLRGHRSATIESMRKAIKWFHDNSDLGESRGISFYGGEPFLCYQEILETVDYARSLCHDKEKLRISVTTNGTMANLRRAKPLFDRGVKLHVSLDGNEATHDWARITHSGFGSFQLIINNLRELAAHYGDELVNHLSLQANIDANSMFDDLVGWEKLLEKEPYLRNVAKHFSRRSLSELTTGRYQSRPVSDIQSKAEYLLKLYIDQTLLRDTQRSELTKWIFDRELAVIHQRDTSSLANCRRVYAGGSCVPGALRVFVSCKGKLYPCERVDERYEIGSVETGIDYVRVTNIITKWQQFLLSVCQGCWAIRFCSKCIASVSEIEDCMTIDNVRLNCQNIRSFWAQKIVLYTLFAEQDIGLLDYFSRARPISSFSEGHKQPTPSLNE